MDEESRIESESEAGVSIRPEHTGSQGQEKRKPSPMTLVFKTIATPVSGWKELKRAHVQPEDMAALSFYRLLALAAASCFADYIYNPDVTLTGTLTNAVVEFVKYFLGYFAVMATCKILPDEIRYRMEMPFGRNFVMTAMCSLVVWSILLQWIPIAAPVLSFLPLYTVYMVFKGVKYLRIPENRHVLSASVISAISILAPYIIGFLFNLLLPTAQPDLEP